MLLKTLHASANLTNSSKSGMMQWKIRHDFMVLNKIESGTGREKHEKLKVRTIQFLECIGTVNTDIPL